jgi:hypothetical protein
MTGALLPLLLLLTVTQTQTMYTCKQSSGRDEGGAIIMFDRIATMTKT